MENQLHHYKCGIDRKAERDDVDPVTTQIIRNSLNSAAEQMKRALCRTAMSPVIYEVLDFAGAIYDNHMRLLAQAPSLPLFMGTLNFCIEEAVKGVGGEKNLNDGDIIIYNSPYGTGSHPQDAALVAPVFFENELIAYTAIKAHWLDIAGKEPYSTDTVDVFQEGTVYPGVKLFNKGELVDDIYKMCIANSRVPNSVAGDINAQAIGVKAGATALKRILSKYGIKKFRAAAESIFDAGEMIVKNYLKKIPNGEYSGSGQMDSNGVEPGNVPFDIKVIIEDEKVILDMSEAPPQQNGPINCPLPSTVSTARVAMSMLAGSNEAPNEGFFRPIEVITKTGTLFHPVSPAPVFLYGWPALQAMEVFYRALGSKFPEKVPASSGGCINAIVWWGIREKNGEPWADGAPHPVGQGASSFGDGATCLHHAESATRFAPAEVWENRNPWLVNRVELIKDSGGAGQYRGGLGVNLEFTMLEDSYATTVCERTQLPPWGLNGGKEGLANNCYVIEENEKITEKPKATRVHVKKGNRVLIQCGGGGGYGNPKERSSEKILDDLKQGYISKEYIKKFHPEVSIS
ncbi:MAG: Acetophenone carboxylase delta subunit [Alphaproteobacteria bacterium MarineAlpha5_Bin5]|nr:MAG: Acetophenone carboxylase delta subunit [Alphaproteobacteria bacterium MarineAlpha5_Bin5]PPR52788.1 MAG: Acetophenone carboxylase delta subunit [Alphaproteobacteria bacterium MarineAlpha5_Bin4]|tara:strand:- start:5795 stop:7513 length:1719 start_codon:yes stop_codon:yes gene_type:complete